MSASPYIPSATSVREVRLETPRLALREHRSDDVDAVLAYAGDPLAMRFQQESIATREQVAGNLAQIESHRCREPRRLRYELAIVRRDDDRLIGWLPLLLSEDGQDGAEVGWTLARDAWGQGYATEAVRALLPFAFGTLHLHRVWARCQSENRTSVKVMEKSGMRKEAYQRENQWFRGRWVDTLQYAILEHEWWGSQRQSLEWQPGYNQPL